MSNRLLNEYAKYTRPISKPYNVFYNGKTQKDQSSVVLNDISDHINTIGNEEYNLHYDTLANTDLAIDLFHVGMLYDREIHTNRVKRASNTSDTEITPVAAVYDVSNNIDEHIYFPFTSEMSTTSATLNTDSGGGVTINIPQITTGSSHSSNVFYKSKIPRNTDISLIFNDEFKHWDISYNNGEIVHVDWICASGGKVKNSELLDKSNTYEWDVTQNQVIDKLTEDVSNNPGINWTVFDISRGVVYIQQTPASDLSYTFGFSDIYDISSLTVAAGTPSDMAVTDIDVYWLDIINQYSSKKTYPTKTRISFAEIKSTSLGTIITENPPVRGGLRPLLDISGYSLTTRYDTSLNPSLKPTQRESIRDSKNIYDELYYGHDWSRVQKYDISSDLQEIAEFGDIYDISDDRLKNHYDIDISRASFDYKFPYLFYKCDDKEGTSTIDPLELNIKYFYDVLTDTSFSDFSFCDASAVISDLNTGFARADMSAGQYDFDGIDLMKCSIEMQEHVKYNAHLKSPFMNISNLGLNDLPNSYLFKGNYYGYYDTSNANTGAYPNIERDERYLVFKFKEPSSYPDTTQDISTNYLLFDPVTQVYRENVPVGGDPYRMIFGLQQNYDASGYIIINADIAEHLYIPIELKPKPNSAIISSMSNNTNVFILDINVISNDFLALDEEQIEPPVGSTSKIIERTQSYPLPARSNIAEPTEIYFGIENKPIKYINGYDISSSLVEIHEHPDYDYQLRVRPTPQTHEEYVLNKEFFFHYPLTGTIDTTIASQWYVGNERYIIETSFNTLVTDEIMTGYIVTRNQQDHTAYNKSHSRITDLSMALMVPNQGTKSYTYIPSHYFSEETKTVLNPVRNRVDFEPDGDISYGLIDKDKSSRISRLTNEQIKGQIGIHTTNNRHVLATISPNDFSTSDGTTRYILPITSTTYPMGANVPEKTDTQGKILPETAKIAENYAIRATISAKHPIQTNNITILTTDSTTIVFELPYRANYSTLPISDTDLSFIIIGESQLGSIVNTGDKRECTFIPDKQTLGGDTAFSDDMITDTLYYKIVYDGKEYTEWNNRITINIINQYDRPEIFNRTFNIYKNESIVIDLVEADMFLIDDAFSNLEVIDVIGPFNGKKVTNFNSPTFSITYEPDSHFLGIDYIFFRVKTTAANATKSQEGHVAFIVSPAPDDEPPVIDDEPTIYEICNCRPVDYTDSTIEQSGGNNPKITAVALGSQLATNMHNYRKTRQTIVMPKREFINQNMRSSNNLGNF